MPATARALVVAQRGDPAHAVRVAREWAERFGARLEVFESGGQLTAHRTMVLDLITEFLNEA